MKWLLMLTGIALLATACASQSEDETMAQSAPINCATAEADLSLHRSEQGHALEQAMGGGRTMVPSGLVTEPEWSTGPVGAGAYSDYLNNRISQIEQACPR